MIDGYYTLELYVAHQRQARGCEQGLATIQQHVPQLQYDLTVVNVTDQPALCEQLGIIVCPTLVVKQNGVPDRCMMGLLEDPHTLAHILGVVLPRALAVSKPQPAAPPQPVEFRPQAFQHEQPQRKILRDVETERRKMRTARRRMA